MKNCRSSIMVMLRPRKSAIGSSSLPCGYQRKSLESIFQRKSTLLQILIKRQSSLFSMAFRAFFDSKVVRDSFFEEIKRNMQFKSWQNFYRYCCKRRNLMEYYRFGHLTMPSKFFDRLCDLLPKESLDFYRTKVNYRSEKWGCVKGGNTTYNLHKEIFEKGRNTAIRKNRLRALRYRFDINIPLSEELCEFLGCFIGDGFTNIYSRTPVIQFAGDRRFDLQYYEDTIIPIARRLFNVKGAYTRLKDNALWVSFYSKSIFKLLTERFGMPVGIKFDKVLIPDEVLNANPNMLTACIRGIFDTDGCVFFDKRPIYREPYIRVELHLYNGMLISQIGHCLRDLGINVKMLSAKTRLQIIGKDSVKQFLEKVGFSNNRHRDRISEFFPSLERITKKLELVQ